MGMDFLPEDTNETRLLASGVTFYLEEHPANKVFFAFEVDSLEEARKMLLGHHCRITSEMQEGFMVSDPYGLSYFVSEKAKDVSQ